MKGSFKLGTVAGIGVFIHWTFSILIAYIIFYNYRQGQNTEQILWTIFFVLSIFITVFLHELGHSLAAKKYHIKTKDITILPIGGIARLEKIPEKPIEELVVASAGPLVNIIIALITLPFISIPNSENLLLAISEGVNASNFFLNFFIINIWLVLFNLIPAFPMDGGRIFRATLSMKLQRTTATNVAARVGQFIAIIFILVGFYSNPFLIFIGVFIFVGAQAEFQYTMAKATLFGYKVKDVMMKDYRTIEMDEKIKTAVNLLINGEYKNFLITQNNNPVGTLSRDDIIKALAQDNSDEISIHQIMNTNLIYIKPDKSLDDIFQWIQEQKSSLLIVSENSIVLGVLDRENILEFIMIQEARTKKKKLKTLNT